MDKDLYDDLDSTKEVDTDKQDRGDEYSSPLQQSELGKDTPADKADSEKKTDSEAQPEDTKKGKKDADISIPKWRFDQAQEKAKNRVQQLEQQLQRLQESQTKTQETKTNSEILTKIDELQDKYEDMLLDGKKDEARKVRRDIEALRDELTERKASAKSEAARKATIAELNYNAQLAKLESEYSTINPDSPDFDEDVAKEISLVVSALVKNGVDGTEALKRGVKYVLGAPPDKKASDAARTLAEQRAKAARERNADADKRQPASTAGVGKDSDAAGLKASDKAIDITKLTVERLSKIDEATLAALRGDEVKA